MHSRIFPRRGQTSRSMIIFEIARFCAELPALKDGRLYPTQGAPCWAWVWGVCPLWAPEVEKIFFSLSGLGMTGDLPPLVWAPPGSYFGRKLGAFRGFGLYLHVLPRSTGYSNPLREGLGRCCFRACPGPSVPPSSGYFDTFRCLFRWSGPPSGSTRISGEITGCPSTSAVRRRCPGRGRDPTFGPPLPHHAPAPEARCLVPSPVVLRCCVYHANCLRRLPRSGPRLGRGAYVRPAPGRSVWLPG